MSPQRNESAVKTSSNNLNRQIGLYSLAAAATGVGLLALARPAAGEVVVTRKTIQIPVTTGDVPHPVRISMANNGVNNFGFNLVNSPPSAGQPFSFRALHLDEATSNANPVLIGFFRTYTPALPRGARIGPSATFSPVGVEVEATYGARTYRRSIGYWGGNPKDHYVGVRFQLKGQTHYGWIRLTVTTSTDTHGPAMSAKITGYAYETVANKPIKAGTAASAAAASEKPIAKLETSKNIQNQRGPSLGMMAAGADALPMWREENLAAK